MNFLEKVKKVFPNAIQTHHWTESTDGEINLRNSQNEKENLTIQVGLKYAGLLKGDPSEFNEIFESNHEKMIEFLNKNYKTKG